MKEIESLLNKFLWSLAPLLWGLALRGIGLSKLPYPLKLIIWGIGTLLLIVGFFGKKFRKNETINVTVLGYFLKIPSLSNIIKVYLILLTITCVISTLGFYQPEFLINGNFLQPFLEELVTQSIFATDYFSLNSFVAFKAISSVAFSLMHFDNYTLTLSSISIAILNHGIFSFILGVVSYRTKRIELSILLHVFSNLDYTLTTIMFSQPYTLLHGLVKLSLMLIIMVSSKKVDRI